MKGNREKLRLGQAVELQPGIKGRLNKNDQTLELSNGKKLRLSEKNLRDLFPANEEAHKFALQKEELQPESTMGEYFHQLGQKGIAGGLHHWWDKITSTGDEYLRKQRAHQEIEEEVAERSPITSGLATATSIAGDIALTKGMTGLTAAPLLTALHAGPDILEHPGDVAKNTIMAAGAGYLGDKFLGGIGKVTTRRAEANAMPERQASVRGQNIAEQQRFATEEQARQEAIRTLPQRQQAEQLKHSDKVLKNVREVEKAFPENHKLLGSQIGVTEFIDDVINTSSSVGTREAGQVAKNLKNVFREDEIITPSQLAKKYETIEKLIQTSTPRAQELLTQFKEFLGKRLPSIGLDSIAHSKIAPILTKDIENSIDEIIKNNLIPRAERVIGNQAAQVIQKKLINTAKMNLKNLMVEIGPDNFVQKLRSGEIERVLKDQVLPEESFLANSYNLTNKAGLNRGNAFEGMSKDFADMLERRIANDIKMNEKNILWAEKAAKKRFQNVSGTYGKAETLSEPDPIRAAEITDVPQLPPAQNVYERLGDFMNRSPIRKPTFNQIGGLGALKYLTGAKMSPVAGAYLGLKGLTSPTAAGEVSRMSFQQGGIQAIVALASKYPSFHDGILEDPQERRSLTKEIENDQEIPLEQKALIQSQINRGKPIGSRL